MDKGKVLFLARSFPPWENVATIRTGSIAKFLARLGWQVSVVTVAPILYARQPSDQPLSSPLAEPNVTRILTGHRARALVSGFLKEKAFMKLRVVGGSIRRFARRAHIDSGVGWTRPVMKSCAHLRPGDVDVILATAPPFSAFVAAAHLAERLRCPYVMDYRDPWSYPSGGRTLIEPWNLPREKRLIRKAGALTIVSPSLRELYVRRFQVPEKTHVITNGFDKEQIGNIKPLRFEHRTVVYAGSLSPPQRTLVPVFEALRTLRQRQEIDNSIRLHYFGRESAHVREGARNMGLDRLVKTHDQVPRKEALAACAGAGVVLVITDVSGRDDLASRGIVTGKIFEALALRRPILLISPKNGDAAHILEITESGRSFLGSDIDGITDFLSEILTGRRNEPDQIAVKQYSWEVISRKLDSILTTVIDDHMVALATVPNKQIDGI